MRRDAGNADGELASKRRLPLLRRSGRVPKDRRELEAMLDALNSGRIIDSNTIAFMRGALRVTDRQAREVMVARTNMAVIQRGDDLLHDVLPEIMDSRHSRYPVVGETLDEVLGILLTKDLLPGLAALGNDEPAPDIIQLLREPLRIPETQPLSVLLQEFRRQQQHMAIAMDEHGGVAGLVTLEDVLEEIVGDILDEDDADAEENLLIQRLGDGIFNVRGETPLEIFNTRFGTALDDPEVGTVGGMLLQHWGHVPQANERATLGNCKFTVRLANRRRIILLELRLPDASATGADSGAA